MKNETVEDLKNKPGYCPNCGAYVGGYPRCDECRDKMPHAKRLQIARVSSILIMIVGLIGLGFYAQKDPAPLVKIGDIGPTYSYGTVTISGNITNIDYRVADDDSWRMLIMDVDDGSGTIEVKAFTEVVREMINEENTPAEGDSCDIRGTVNIKGNEKYVLLGSSMHFRPERTPVVDDYFTAEELSDSHADDSSPYLNEWVRVRGNVTYVNDDSKIIELDGILTIYVPKQVQDFSPNSVWNFTANTEIEVIGRVKEYYGDLEVVPAHMSDIEVLGYVGGGNIND